MNLILNHLNLMGWLILWIGVILNALQFVDWIQLRFGMYEDRKLIVGSLNKPNSLDSYKLNYERQA